MLFNDFVREVYHGRIVVEPHHTYFLTLRNNEPDLRLVTIGDSYTPPPIDSSPNRIQTVNFGKHSFIIVTDCGNLNVQTYPIPTHHGTLWYNWILPNYYDTNKYFRRCRFKGTRRLDVYPKQLLDILDIDESMFLNPFQIHGYHGSGMRTNVDTVHLKNFLKTEEENNTQIETYLGLELEICGYEEDAINDIDAFMADPQNLDVFEHFDASHDGSLDNCGIELVSLPMTYKYLISKREMFEKLYRFVDDFGLTCSHASMHIHFDITFVKKVIAESGYRYLNYVWDNNANHSRKLNYIVGRPGNNYCRFLPISESESAVGRVYGDHGRWISGTQRTFEIRRYAANLNFDDLLLKVDFTMEIFNMILKLKKLPLDQFDLGCVYLDQIINEYYIKKIDLVDKLVNTLDTDSNWNDTFQYWNESNIVRNRRRGE